MKETIKKFGAWLLAAALAFTGAGAAMAETVAKIGETPYESLAAAIAEATAGQTVEIVLAGDYTLPGINKEITVKAAKDVAVNVPLKAVSGGTMGSFNGVTFEGMTFTVDKNVDYTGINLGADQRVSFVNCTFHRRLTTYGSMICTGCTFNQDGADYCITAYGPYDKEHELKFTNCTFNNTNKGKFLNLYNQNRKTYDVTIEGCTFDNKGTESKAAILIKEIAPNNVFGCFNVYIKGTNTLKGLFPSGIYETEVTAAGGNGLWANEGANPPTEYVTVFVNGLEVYPHAAVPEIEVVVPTVSEEKGITQEIVNQITTNTEVAKVEETGLKAALAEDETLKDAEAVVKVELKEAAKDTSGVLTYEIKPVVKGEGETPDEDISAKVAGKPITFRVPLTDAFSDVAKVTHKGEVDEISHVKVLGDAGSRYVELTFVHFSEVDFAPENWPDATPVKIGDTFYASLGEAIKAGVADAEILCKPGATIPVGSNVHEPFLKSTTIYGNGAVLASSSEYSLGSIPADGSTYSIKVFNLGKIGLWDAVKAGVKIDILVEDCQDVHEVQIQVQNGGSSSVVNTVVRNCTFDMVNGSAHMSGVSQDCGGSVLVEGCSFNGLLCGVNVKNDVGALTTTVKDCTFVDCGLVGNEWNKESNTNLGAPIRVGSKEGATNAAIIENNEISYAAGSQKILEGDVIIGDNRPGKDAAGEVTYTVSGTAAKVDVYPVHGKLSGDEADAFTKDAEKSVVLTVTESAEGKNESKAYAAYIGTTGYETIQAAVNAADVSAGPVTIKVMAGTHNGGVDLKKDNLTFEEGGKIWYGRINLVGEEDAIISGQITTGNGGAFNVADVTIEGLRFIDSSYPIYIDNNAGYTKNVTIKNNTFDYKGPGPYVMGGVNDGLTVTGNKFNSTSGNNATIGGDGCALDNVSISGNVFANWFGIYGQVLEGGVSVSGNTFTSGGYGIWINDNKAANLGKIVMAGNAFAGTVAYPIGFYDKYGKKSDITIGADNTYGGEAITGWAEIADDGVLISSAVLGSYAQYYDHKLYLGDETAFESLEDAVAASTGDEPITIVNYDSSTMTTAPTGWEFKTDSETGITTLVKKAAAVCQIGTTTYPSIAAALEAIGATESKTGTIKMIDNETMPGNKGVVIPSGYDVTLDLNGFRVCNDATESGYSETIEIAANAKLTVKDTSDDANGVIINAVAEGTNGDWGSTPRKNWASNTVVNHGTFILESGNIVNTTGGISYCVDNNSNVSACKFVMNGGKLYNNYGDQAVRLCAISGSSINQKLENRFEMHGGEIVTGGFWVQMDGAIGGNFDAGKNWATVIVDGGTINGFIDVGNQGTCDVEIGGNAVINASKMRFRSLGGADKFVKFTGGKISIPEFEDQTAADYFPAVVSGGVFTEAAKTGLANYVAEGHAFVENTDPDTSETYPWMVGEVVAEVAAVISADGTTTNKYATLAEAFAAVQNGETVELLCDVDLKSEPWTPVVQNGSFDGMGFAISNLVINAPEQNGVGFFSEQAGRGMAIKNVDFVNVDVKGLCNVGALVGSHCYGLVSNVTVSGMIKVEATGGDSEYGYSRAGVICGGWSYGTYKNVTVDGGEKATSYVKGPMSGVDGRYVAGFIGHAEEVDVYENCSVRNLTVTGKYLSAGFCGAGPYYATCNGCTVENVEMTKSYSGALFAYFHSSTSKKPVVENTVIRNVTFPNNSHCGTIGTSGVDFNVTVKNVTIEGVPPVEYNYQVYVTDGADNLHFANLATAIAEVENLADITVASNEIEVPAGYVLYEKGDFWGVKSSNVVRVGTTEYGSIAEALEKSSGNVVMTLIADATTTGSIELYDSKNAQISNLTIDLNGFKLTNKGGGALQAKSNRSIVITDTVGTGEFVHTGKDYLASVNGTGKVIINGGTFTIAGNDYSYGWCFGSPIASATNLVVRGGKFSADPASGIRYYKNPCNFVAEGYESVAQGTSPETWKVQEKTVKTEDDKPIVVDISKAGGEPSAEAVEVPVTVTQELANEILNEIMGQSVNVTQPLTEAQVQTIVTQLETKGEDGMTGWQKYAAGFSQTDKHPLAPKGKGTDDGKLVLVTSLVAPKQLSVDTGVKVKYILMQGSNVNQATGLPTAWTKVQELPTPEFPVDVTQLDPETYWKIDVEYTATKVVETEVETGN